MSTAAHRTLVLGGARSGKSGHAESLMPAGAVRYIATSALDPDDTDWADRIEEHRRRRPAHWTTLESASGPGLAELLRAGGPPTLVDDLGTWLTTELDAANAWDAPRGTIGTRCDDLVDAVSGHAGMLVLVSPEVGLGVIPETRSGRLFRDEIGALNGRLAQVCDEVLLSVAGLTVRLK
ncbi:bifunctional cobinamide kinase and cobinamide phosphate guanylyltransferase [Rhodococcus sp. RD6.2]|uniref:bifunctional adenosylcobinamide kinase/adenosylcobinamide-phosphate guanylyltransferase n=1 Tax=Rhodococcus sp. RD6.2 TaxID=260936 RepID=UPI00063B32DB|nr:bifunctional adenosylcobinamide kinase/adenosylcobinamide-phosphate guanylyltransferase [Rhodococcus sp. RD6.2]CRK51821.1 bifunctional cobinamide kinase and cobinamide phosphate guanylyltransferase [Rhodococcus sp. RD6.2]